MAKFCEYCGAPLQDGASFCTGCGHSVALKSQPSQQSQQGNQVNFQPSAQSYRPQRPKKKGGGIKALLIVTLISVLGYGGWEYYQDREAKRTRERLTKDYPEKMKELEQRQQKTSGSQGAENTAPKELETKKPDQVLVHQSEEDLLEGREPIETIDFESDLQSGYTTVELNEQADEYYYDNGYFTFGCMSFQLASSHPSTTHLKSHVKFVNNGNFSITASGEYTNDNDYYEETSVDVNGHVDRKTGKGTFTMKGTIKNIHGIMATVETSGEVTPDQEHFNNVTKEYYHGRQGKSYLYYDMQGFNSNKGGVILIRGGEAHINEKNSSFSKDCDYVGFINNLISE